MLIAIIVWLAIGALTVVLCRKELMDVVKDDSLATKIEFFTWMTISGPICFVYGVVKGICQSDEN